MLFSTLVLGFAGFGSAAKVTPRKSPKGVHRNLAAMNNNPQLLTTRDTCSSTKTSCDIDYCIPDDGMCCYDGDGAYCKAGEYCVTGGCCEDGEICTDDGDDDDGDDDDDEYGDHFQCEDDEEECNMSCMPIGSLCCETGIYCDADETCGDGLFCDSDSSDGDSEDEDDDGPTLCTRKGRGGGGGDFGGGGDDDDGCGAAGSLSVPGLLVVLAATVPLVL